VLSLFDALKALVSRPKKKELPGLEEKRKKVQSSTRQSADAKEQHDSRVADAVAAH